MYKKLLPHQDRGELEFGVHTSKRKILLKEEETVRNDQVVQNSGVSSFHSITGGCCGE
jgi:hypothetical protein